MSIDKNNYELFLMDCLDGKLDAGEVSEVLLFLEQNPDIKAEFEGIAAINVAEVSETPVSFAHLKQHEFDHIKQAYEPLLIASMEGALTAEESVVLERGFKLYPELTREQKLFSQTILQPDYTLKFPDKQSLKRGSMWVVHRTAFMRAAAVLLMALTAGWFLAGNQYTSVAPAQQTAVLPKVIHSQHAAPLQASDSPASSQPSRNEGSNNKQVKKAEPNALKMKHFELALIPEMESREIESSNPAIEHKWNGVSTWLTYTQPTFPAKVEDHFPDLKTLAGVGLNRGAQQLEEKTLSVFQAMNKAAGVSMEKDETTGKIKRFEIARLGFEWSQSK